jgi:hypothetical protein
MSLRGYATWGGGIVASSADPSPKGLGDFLYSHDSPQFRIGPKIEFFGWFKKADTTAFIGGTLEFSR